MVATGFVALGSDFKVPAKVIISFLFSWSINSD